MKRIIFIIVIGIAFFDSCDNPQNKKGHVQKFEHRTITLNESNYGNSISQNVTIYDSDGNWYATGLLVESSSKVSLRIERDNYELVSSDKDVFRYKLKDYSLYVK